MGTMTQPTNDSMTCKGCGRDLPLSAFKLTRWGTHAKICNDCVAEKRTEAEAERAYISKKREIIKQIADKYRNKMPELPYLAIINHQFS